MADPDQLGKARQSLPHAYALALELRDLGLPNEEIAERLDIEPTAVGPLLVMAEAKLEAILRGASSG